MIREILQETEEKMKKAIEALRRDLAGMKAGRATPSLLDKVLVEYYGAMTPVNQLANIQVPEARLLVITPWDKTALPAIEKAIQKSDLGLSPSSDGAVIRLVIPQLTQERRQELVKVIRKKAEDERVAIRNMRRDANDMIKELEKAHEVAEDESRRAQDEVQKLTDRYIREVDHVLELKEKEVLEV